MKTLLTLALLAVLPLAHAAPRDKVFVNAATLEDVRNQGLRAVQQLQQAYEYYEATPHEMKLFEREVLGMYADEQYFENFWEVGDGEAFKLKMMMRLARRLNAMQDMVSEQFEESRKVYCDQVEQTHEVWGDEYTETSFVPKSDTPEERGAVFCVYDTPRIVPFS